MFFQVGDPARMKFKTGYFDMVIADRALHSVTNPSEAFAELHRVAKPRGAILIRELRRPSLFEFAGHLARHRTRYDPRLRDRFQAGVRAGFTPSELIEFAERAGVERARIIAEDTHVILERPGTNDPASWVTEREKYV